MLLIFVLGMSVNPQHVLLFRTVEILILMESNEFREGCVQQVPEPICINGDIYI